jgi:hypothetical protein
MRINEEVRINRLCKRNLGGDGRGLKGEMEGSIYTPSVSCFAHHDQNRTNANIHKQNNTKYCRPLPSPSQLPDSWPVRS